MPASSELLLLKFSGLLGTHEAWFGKSIPRDDVSFFLFSSLFLFFSFSSPITCHDRYTRISIWLSRNFNFNFKLFRVVFSLFFFFLSFRFRQRDSVHLFNFWSRFHAIFGSDVYLFQQFSVRGVQRDVSSFNYRNHVLLLLCTRIVLPVCFILFFSPCSFIFYLTSVSLRLRVTFRSKQLFATQRERHILTRNIIIHRR